MLKKFSVVWYRVIRVSALSLSLRDKEREKREIELDNNKGFIKDIDTIIWSQGGIFFVKAGTKKTTI